MARKISNWIRTWLENATTRIASSVPLVAVGAFAVAMVLRNAPFDVKEALVSDTDAMEIAVEAWLYGYPLITMDMTRRLMTNVTAPEGKQAPMGRWAKLRNFPPLLSRDIAAPNPDTLYTTAWIDLSRAPYILGIPNSKGRYYLMPILDAWTNVVASPGSRTTGTAAQRYIITGPNWTGSRNTSPQPISSGSWAEFTAPEHRRTTRKSMRFKKNSLCCRRPQSARLIRLPRAPSTPRWMP